MKKIREVSTDVLTYLLVKDVFGLPLALSNILQTGRNTHTQTDTVRTNKMRIFVHKTNIFFAIFLKIMTQKNEEKNMYVYFLDQDSVR